MNQVSKTKRAIRGVDPKSRALTVARQRAAATRLRNQWWFAFGVVITAACILRLLFPDLKPLHHDEGVNGLFMTNLFRNGYYHYDPANYHGPTLYYFGLVTTTLNALFYGKEGLSTFAIRLVPAVFGIGLIWLVFSLRSYLGALSTVAAAALLAVSPGMVFFSRYFIHEIPFVFLTLALVLTALRYRETARPRYLMLASACAALMFATKETCIISYAVLALSWVCMRVYFWLRKKPDGLPPRQPVTGEPDAQGKTIKDGLLLAGLAALVFIVISVLFYSSFFTNFPRGVIDSLRTFAIWTNRGVQTDQYRAPRITYLIWLRKEELPILALGGLGIVIALWKARNGFAVFTAFWALGMTAAYSLLPYKTPWLALNFILPLGIMAGYGLAQWHGSSVPGNVDSGVLRLLLRIRGVLTRMWAALGRIGTALARIWAALVRVWPVLARVSSVLVFVAALVFSAYQAIDISFFRYDDDSVPYVYAHTSRQLLELVDEVESIAARSPTGKNTGMTIVSGVYWPLPWYLRDYPQAIFWGKMVKTTEPILIASGDQTGQVEQDLGRYYAEYRAYELRPGNFLVLYLRRDIQP